MINNDRIVPIEVYDLLSMVGLIMKLAGTTVAKVSASNPAEFTVTGTGDVGNKLADEPVKVLDFASGVTAGVVYFVPSYDYEGFKVAGTAVETAGAEVEADGRTLYTATLSSGNVTIAKVAF